MLDCDNWNEDEQRFFEILIPIKEEDESNKNEEERIFIQIRRLKVEYN